MFVPSLEAFAEDGLDVSPPDRPEWLAIPAGAAGGCGHLRTIGFENDLRAVVHMPQEASYVSIITAPGSPNLDLSIGIDVAALYFRSTLLTVPLSPAAELSPATAVLLQSVRVRTPQLAAVLYDLGFSLLSGKLVFIIGRVAGLTAEVAEEYAREKAMRIHIPVTYDGVPTRELD